MKLKGAIATIAALFVCLLLVQPAHAAVLTIPDASTMVSSSTKLKLSNDNVTVTWGSAKGSISYEGDGIWYLIPVPSTTSNWSYANLCDFTFSNAGTINGRSINVRIHVDSLKVYEPGWYANNSWMAFAGFWSDSASTPKTFWWDCTSGPYGTSTKWTVDTTTTIYYADTGETVKLPFFQSIADLDVYGSEGWEALSGYEGNYYIYSQCLLDISGNKFSASERIWDYGGTSGTDSLLLAGLYAPTTSGSFKSRFYEGSCGSEVQLYSQYSLLKKPTKTVDSSKIYQPGETITYDVKQKVGTFYSDTMSTYSSMVMEDVLPSGVTYQSVKVLNGSGRDITSSAGSASYNSSTRKLTYTFNSSWLKEKGNYNGQTLTMRITVKATEPAASLVSVSNKATVSVTGVSYTTNTVNVKIAKPVLSIRKTASASAVKLGDAFSYTVSVSQTNSNATGTNVVVSDTIPSGLTLLGTPSVSGASASVTTSGSTWTVKAAKLKYDETIEITFSVRAESESGGKTLTNTATASVDYGNDVSSSANVYVACGWIDLTKISSNPEPVKDNEYYKLSGAVYGVFASEADASSLTDSITTMTTDESGYAKSGSLRPDTYWVREVIPSSGYKLDEGIYEAVVEDSATVSLRSIEEPILTSVRVMKDWNDDSDRDGLRPGSLTVTLCGSDGSSRDTVLDSSGNWRYTYVDLPVYYGQGDLVEYSVGEEEVAGYETEVSKSEDGYSFLIVNTHAPATTPVSVKKAWEDEGDRDGLRSDAVITLSGSDGSSYGAVIPAHGVTVGVTFNRVFVYYDHGRVIDYSLSENPIDGYVSDITEGEDGYSFVVTNTHVPATKSIPVLKTWEDDNDRDGLRPGSLEFTLNGSDGSKRTLALDAYSGWEGSFDDLPVFFDHGTEISYSLEEQAVEGYSSSITQDDAGGYAVGNSHDIQTVNIPVTAAWVDDEDRDGLRLEAVKVTLSGSDGSMREMELNIEGGFSGIFKDLPKYYDGGKVIEYSLSEEAISGYVIDIAGDEDGYSFTVTNTHVPALRAISVEKAWEDDNDRDGLRPEFVSVTLAGSDGSQRKAELCAGDGWEVLFENLPVNHDHGTRIEYTLSEDEVDGYVSQVSGNADGSRLTMTNTHVPATKSIPVSKTWEDDNDRDGLRPESLEFTLNGSDGSKRTLALDAYSGWEGSFDDLPVFFDHGTEISYSLEEQAVEGYSSSITQDDAGGYAVGNSHDVATATIHVVKDWSDADNQDGVRPEVINVTLKGTDGSVYEGKLTKASGWTCDFNALPIYFSHGAKIEYSLTEAPVNGYTDKITKSEDGYSFTITNEHIPAVTNIIVTKAWDDDEDRDGLRPESVKVMLSGSDGNTYEKLLCAEDGYAGVFEDLPVHYDEGEVVSYKLTEDPVEGYASDIVKDEGGYSFIVTNVHEPETISVNTLVVWDDDEDRDGIRPGESRLVLIGSDGSEYAIPATASEAWRNVLENLPAYFDHGKKIEYSLTEDFVEGYETAVAKDGSYSFIATNVHLPTTTSIPVTKMWEDKDNQDGIRPTAVKVMLSGSDGSVRELELSSEGGWSGSFSSLPLFFDHGKCIEYALSEAEVEGYVSEAVMSAEDGTVTNTHVPEVRTLYVSKTWSDDDNRDGLRPESVKVTLSGSDGSERILTLSAEDDFTGVFEDLPVYFEQGTKIEYALSEEAVTGYETQVNLADNGNLFQVANIHVPAMETLSVEKAWNDDDDYDGLRPESVKVTLSGSDGSERTIELSAKHDWRGTFPQLPVYYDGGKEVAYTLTEEAVEGYEADVQVLDDGTGFIVTNTHERDIVEKVADTVGKAAGSFYDKTGVELGGFAGMVVALLIGALGAGACGARMRRKGREEGR